MVRVSHGGFYVRPLESGPLPSRPMPGLDLCLRSSIRASLNPLKELGCHGRRRREPQAYEKTSHFL